MPYAGSTAPNGNFLLCAAQSLLRADYPALFTAIGTTYGAADGTHFSLPDLRGRVPAGQDNMNGSAASRIGTVSTDSGTITGSTIGSAGGSSTHVQTTPEMALHLHANSVTSNTTSISDNISYSTTAGGVNGVMAPGSTGTATISYLSDPGHGHAMTNANTGSSTAMAWLQPTIIVPYIIRVL